MSASAHLHRIDRETQSAFNELLLIEELSRLPVGSLLRVLKTIPAGVLEVALSEASRSPCRDGWGAPGCRPRPGSR